MPYWGCTACHHEWEGSEGVCDWCGAKGKVLEEKTPLERMVEALVEDSLDSFGLGKMENGEADGDGAT